MNALVESIAKIFEKLSNRHRLISLLIVMVILSWIDSQMGFTYHYFTDKKIDEIVKFNQILKDTSLDSQTKTILSNERMAIISKNRAIVEPLQHQEIKQGIWFHLSYGGIILLVTILLPFSINREPISRETKNNKIMWSIFLCIGILIVFYLFANWFSNFLQPPFLYLANILLQVGILWVSVIYANRKINSRL